MATATGPGAPLHEPVSNVWRRRPLAALKIMGPGAWFLPILLLNSRLFDYHGTPSARAVELAALTLFVMTMLGMGVVFLLLLRNSQLFISDELFGCVDWRGESRAFSRSALAKVEATNSALWFVDDLGRIMFKLRRSGWYVYQLRDFVGQLGVPNDLT